jgi:hypothetical protein
VCSWAEPHHALLQRAGWFEFAVDVEVILGYER